MIVSKKLEKRVTLINTQMKTLHVNNEKVINMLQTTEQM